MKWMLLPLLLIGRLVSLAQAPTLERIGIEKGLSQGFVTSILQDEEGFIWAGTMNGLNRFDGHRFLSFTHDPFDPHSISSDIVSTIAECGDYLLVGTLGNGFNIFHKKTQRFFRLPYLAAEQDSAPKGRVLGGRHCPAENVKGSIAQDAKGDIWLKISKNREYDEGAWAVRMRVPPGFWEKLPDEPALLEEVRFDTWWLEKWDVYAYISGNLGLAVYDGNVYLSQLDGLLGFDAGQAQWVPSPHFRLAEGAASIVVRSVAGDGRYLAQSPDWATYHCPTPGTCTPIGQLPGPILAWDERFVWVREAEHIVAYPFSPSPFAVLRQAARRLPLRDKRTVMCFDRSGNLWYTEGTDGLLKYSPIRDRFEHQFKGESIMTKPFMSRRGGLYYRSTPYGIHYGGAPDPALEAIGKVYEREGLLSFNINDDGKGHYWMAAYRDEIKGTHLVKVDADRGDYSLIRVPSKGGVPFCASFDEQGKLWFPADGLLISYDPHLPGPPDDAARWAIYDYRAAVKLLDPVVQMEKTPDGSWWLATYSGLIRAKPKAEGFDFSLYKTDPDKPRSLYSSNVSALLADPKDPNRLWVGTKGGGLGCLHIGTGEVNTLDTKKGLPDDVIYGLLSDHNMMPAGQDFSLWISTNRGIVSYTPATGKIRHFTKADGLQDDEFNTHAFAYTNNRQRSGKLMFGGVKGLNLFDPRSLVENPQKPKVFITGLKINDKALSVRDSSKLLSNAIEYTERISLPYHQNNLSFAFAALEFTAPSKNRYRYWIEGLEAENAHESTEPYANYLGLPPGNYTFVVYGSNNDGVWCDSPARLRIRILPPWWRSWAAYMAYALLAGALAYAAFQMQINRIRLRNELYFNKKEAQALQAVDEIKTRFFTNVTHELRTPLSLIALPLQRLLQQEEDEQKQQLLHFASKNSQRLLRLVNEVLDFAKLDAARLAVEKSQVPVLPFARRVLAEFESLAAHKGIRLRLESQVPESLVLVFDLKKVETVLYNLVSNALKFTQEGGQVIVEAKSAGSELAFEVRDSGRGIAPEDLPHIFDRFYQSRSNLLAEGGTGIGLALSKELLDLMGGHISVESQIGQGSVFRFVLPCSPGHANTPLAAMPSPGTALPRPSTAASADLNAGLPHLLIVEDNEDLQRYLAFALQDTYQLALANNGRAALDYLAHCEAELRPALIISDVMMPEMDGFQLLQHLKSSPDYRHIPVVMLTARSGQEDKLSALRIGVDDYLTKPFDEEELRVRIQNLIDRSLLRHQFRAIALDADAPAKDGAAGMEKDEKDLDAEWLADLEHYILTHLKDPTFSVNSAAAHFGMSRFKFTRAIGLAVGMTAADYFQEVRLCEGRRLLEAKPDLLVRDVAAAVGFANPKLFSRKFQQRFGTYPSGYSKDNN